MITRAHRFHGYNSLRAVYQRGQTARSPLISLKFTNRGGDRPYRVAVVVSKKVSKSAVTRNRIRRRIYEQVRLADEQIAPSSDLLFTVFGEQVATIEAQKLSETIQGLLQKVPSGQKAPQTSVSSEPNHDIVKAEGNHGK